MEYPEQELIGRHLLDFVESGCKQSFSHEFSELIKSEEIYCFTTNFLSKLGKEIICEIKGKVLKENGKIFSMLGLAEDITEITKLKEQIKDLNYRLIEANRIISIESQRAKHRKALLEELNKLKNEFVSNISHEMRTPLASIIGFAETIASDPGMPDEMQNEFVEIILSEGKRLAKLINDVLDISRIESGNIVVNKEEIDIVQLLNEALNLHRKAIERKKLKLTFNLPDNEILIYGDRERILQVLDNIISNAVKFTNPEGRIMVSVQSLYKEVEILVTDTGIGIPKKDLPFIFEKFYRVNRPGLEIPGAGLGLVFSKQIVDLHKGLILIRSEENQGTTVLIKLPKLLKFQPNKD